MKKNAMEILLDELFDCAAVEAEPEVFNANFRCNETLEIVMNQLEILGVDRRCFDAYADAVTQHMAFYSEATFRQGFHAGMRLIKDIQDYNSKAEVIREMREKKAG